MKNIFVSLLAISLILNSSFAKAELKIEKIDTYVDLADIPPLEYDESTLLYAQKFVTFLNQGDYKSLYNMFSQQLKSQTAYEQAKEIFKSLKHLFGTINNLGEISMGNPDTTLTDPNNPNSYLMARLEIWNLCLDQNFKVRIYKVDCKEKNAYLFLALSGSEDKYKINVFDLTSMKREWYKPGNKGK